tara:strand:- start:1683 stop:1922 length:240 start_codon:yes stop_codon:yes gene_type:complete
MSNWKEMVPGCFGETDKIFAEHPLDEDRAFELLKVCRDQSIGWAALEREFQSFLSGLDPSHVSRQITKARRMMKEWLLD